jgi:hypothetical protein
MKYSSLFCAIFAYIIPKKFCKDCVHFIPDKLGNQYGKCRLFSLELRDDYLVTGEVTKKDTDYFYCTTARDSNRLCGPNGKKYQIEGEDD